MRRKSRSNYVRGGVPLIYHSRSKFDLSYDHKTTGNVGDLLPLYVQEVYAGDTFKCDASIVARVTSSFLKPVMDNLFCDVMFFFVPSRTVFDQWAEIFGENNDDAWARKTFVQAPTFGEQGSDDVFDSHDLASYLGMPVGGSMHANVVNGGVNVLPFRAYAKIYNEWYRDENLIDPMHIQKGDWSNVTERLNHSPFGPDNYTGKVAKVAKMHDYFTQLLPAPQKGASVDVLPLSGFSDVPVTTGSSAYVGNTRIPMLFQTVDGSSFPAGSTRALSLYNGADIPAANSRLEYASNSGSASPPYQDVLPSNLQALTSQLTFPSVSINDFRMAFQTQKMLERDAIFGTRNVERLKSVFGVSSPDSVLQRSEFLGGRRFPISVIQATQTSSAVEKSPLGQVAGWSLSNGRAGYTKGFTEEGFVIGMVCIRQFHTYQQGIEKFWWRKKRLDYLNPLFSSVGYQPVAVKELYSDVGLIDGNEAVMGYAPIYEDLRCRNNRISGQLASKAGQALDIWHFADLYNTAPVLGQQWIEETPLYVDRALSVPSESVDQFIFDVYFKQYAIRVLPTYGEPGLIDHH